MNIPILYIGCNPEINPVMERLISSHEGWEGTVVASVEEAILQVHRQAFDVVLLGNGLTEEEERKLEAIVARQQPEAAVIRHYGGGSGLLENEVREALDRRGSGLSFFDPY